MDCPSQVGVCRASEAGFNQNLFFDCLPVACYACDRDGTVTHYNRQAVELWGRTPCATDRFTGAHKLLDIHGHPLAPHDAPIAFLLRSGLAQLNRELVIERPDGNRITVLSNMAPLHNEEGNLAGALDVLQDITNRRRLEDARRLAARLSAAARIATEVAQLKPALLSVVSLLEQIDHDTTLSVEARGYAELARMELVRFDTLMKHMSHLSGAA